MVHEENKELNSLILSRSKLIDQTILFDKAQIIGVPTEPWTPFFRINNFFQRTFAHQLGFDNTNEKFRLLQVDADGNLKVSSTVSVTFAALVAGVSTSLKGNSAGALKVDNSGRNFTTANIFTDELHPANGMLTHTPFDARNYAVVSAMVSTTQQCTVDFQVSDDGVTFYEPVNVSDATFSWSVNSQKKSFNIPELAPYIRVRITNTNNVQGSTTLRINAQG